MALHSAFVGSAKNLVLTHSSMIWSLDAAAFDDTLCDAQIVNETLPALQKLKEQGLVRFIGITSLPLKIFRSVLDRCSVAPQCTHSANKYRAP